MLANMTMCKRNQFKKFKLKYERIHKQTKKNRWTLSRPWMIDSLIIDGFI